MTRGEWFTILYLWAFESNSALSSRKITVKIFTSRTAYHTYVELVTCLVEGLLEWKISFLSSSIGKEGGYQPARKC